MNSPYTYRFEHDIRWRDLDALNHVNNAMYFTFFEEARIRFFDELGQGGVIVPKDVGTILAHIECDFLSPVLYPDTLSIGCGVTRIGTKSFSISHDIFSDAQQKIVCTSNSVIVMLNYTTNQTVEIPDHLRSELDKFLIK